jgi:PPOX class probable F420-dependent enzyme
MEVEKALAHFREHHHSVLATRRRDGSPQLSPVVHAVGNDGRILISTREAAMKAVNIRRDPRVSICALSDTFFGAWVQVDGEASVIPLPQAMDLLRFTYAQIAGEHPDWDEFQRDMVAQQRVVLAITPTRAGPDRSG